MPQSADELSATPGRDPEIAGAHLGAFYREVAHLAALMASVPGTERHASIHLVDGGTVTCVAASAGDGETEGSSPLSAHPDFEQAIGTGAPVVRSATATIPVLSRGSALAVLQVAAPDGIEFLDLEVERLVRLAHIVGLALNDDATVRELHEEAERSRNLERLKSEFLNIAAHELRSPLGIIRGYASLLTDVPLAAADRDHALELIAEKSEEMAHLISDMLDTARLETLGLDLSLAPLDLVDVVAGAVAAMRPLVGGNHRFVVQLGTDAILVVGDRRRLTTMITNLIDNAIKYSPDGGDIEVVCERGAQGAVIRVRDAGIGVGAEQLPVLFTRFGRVITPETTHIRGTGLGLYLARETARLHGGEITVASEPGRGSSFTIELPLAERADASGVPPSPAP